MRVCLTGTSVETHFLQSACILRHSIAESPRQPKQPLSLLIGRARMIAAHHRAVTGIKCRSSY